MALFTFGDSRPQLQAESFVVENATVIGNVTLGERSSIWYGAVVRGDNDLIAIGDESNVQDGCVLHVDAGYPISVGQGSTIGHQVMLHGCTIGDNTLIGIQSVILNGARIGRDSIVGACSLVTMGKVFPDGVLIAGSPAKVVRELTPEQIASNRLAAQQYIEQMRRHRASTRPVA